MRKRISLASLIVIGAGALVWIGVHGLPSGWRAAPARAAEGEGDAEAALRKAGTSYVEAYNRGDIDGLVAHWAPDGDYIDQHGQAHKGRQALATLYRQSMETFKGYKLTGRILAVRFLKPDVAIEDGILDLTGPGGNVHPGRYTTVWVKREDRWLISSARDLATDPAAGAPTSAERLKELQWLVGDWEHTDGADKLTISCRWAPNKSFLIQEFHARVKDGDALQVTQYVGWNPVEEKIHSWFFDSHGGFGQSLWTRTGNTWRVQGEGVTPDGRTGTSVGIWKFVDDKSFHWQLTERELDGAPLPDVDAHLVRGKTEK